MDQANYIEYVLENIQDSEINTIMSRFFHLKSSIKEFKVQKKNNVVMENYNHEIIKVYSIKLIDNSIKTEFDKNIHVYFYQKDKLHYHAYSCSMQVDDEYNVRRVTFRITNNIFLNFDTEYHKNTHCKTKIFINYNHDKNQDMDFVNAKISQISQSLAR
jgi:hypothetical protein